MNLLLKRLTGIVDLICPRRCLLCGGLLLDAEGKICTYCKAQFEATNYHTDIHNGMVERFAEFPELENASAFFFYSPDSELAQAVQTAKYRHQPQIVRELGRDVASRLLMTGFFNGIDAILPVPLHFIKQMRRGYNQSRVLAKGYSEITGIPIAANLRAVRPHATQTGKSHNERRRNVADVFAVSRPEQLRGKHLLLVDDVCTTGSTIRECAMTLRRALAPNFRFSVLTLCCTHR